jgi:type IV pilus assembly protein PilO
MALLDPITNAPRSQKLIAGVFGLVVVAVLGYFLFIAPKIAERDSVRQQGDSVRTEVLRARADEANLRPFRAQAEELRKRLQAAKERLPSEKEMPKLYRHLTDLAFQSGLHVALFIPKPPEDREDVAEVPITMSCEGSYHQLGAFFARVSRLPRIVDLGDFRLTGIERPTGTLRADLTLETFIFRPEGAASPAKPRAPGPAPAAPGQPGRTGQ